MKAAIERAFRERFGTDPEHVVRSPGRVNLIGEHTDYNDGYVLPVAIDRAIWLALRPRRDGRVRLHSLDEPDPVDFSIDAFGPSGEGWAEYVKGMTRALLDSGRKLVGWEGVLASGIPIGAGLSSSAALEMAVAAAFAAVSGFAFEADAMARLGQVAENDWVGARTGIMDPMIVAQGRAGHALWIDCRSLERAAVPLPRGVAILVMDTGTRHDHASSGYNDRRAACERAAGRLGVSHLRDLSSKDFETRAGMLAATDRRRARHVVHENERVLAMLDAMRGGDVEAMGRLMDESHESLARDFEVTNRALDAMVRIVRSRPGCRGARMTGGGFGGCAIALVDAARAEAIGEEVRDAWEAAMGGRPEVFVTRASKGTSLV
ncbi:MAG TPA: galactokinase [Deltaproteobacteria bacterium]|nr:galactokinase [Deltaproteobacteria bacterium]